MKKKVCAFFLMFILGIAEVFSFWSVKAEELETYPASFQLEVKLVDGFFYFTWDDEDENALYQLEYNLFPVGVFGQDGVVTKEEAPVGKMCYSTNALPYAHNLPVYFRIKKTPYYSETVTYSNVYEFNWPEYTVTFMDGDTVLQTSKICLGDYVTAPTCSKDGYELSWDKSFERVISDIVVHAVWTPKKTDITMQSPAQNTVNKDQNLSADQKTSESYTQPKQQILVGKVSGVKLKVKSHGRVYVEWKKVTDAKKYQIVISQSKNFKQAKKIYTRNNNVAVKALKRKKKYYVRVRAYANGKYGAWSVVKKIKVK